MHFNLIQLIVLLTFINSTFLNCRKKDNFLLLCIVITCLSTELISFLLLYLDKKINLLYSFSFLIHNGFWLLILIKKIVNIKIVVLFLTLYISFCVFNMFYIEGINVINFNIFIFGSLLYLISFIIYSFSKLKNEDLIFFQSDSFLLICVPLLFFLGLSLLFSFKSYSLFSVTIFKDVNLYKLLTHFVNIIYYTLINMYIYKERKLHSKNA
jgi:hypothetical protein